MTRRSLSVIFTLLLLAGPAPATNITAQSEETQDQIQALRQLAETMLKDRAGAGTPAEGEELITRPGGSTGSGTAAGDSNWQAALAKLGAAVQLNDLPSVLQEMRQSQGDTFGQMQAAYKTLTAADSVSDDQQKLLLKNLERQLAVVLEDQTILDGLLLNVQAARATASPSELALLADSLKAIGSAKSALQSYQNELTKMSRTEFKTATTYAPDAKQITEQVAAVAAPVDTLVGELQANPKGMSQDFFAEGADSLNSALSSLNELRAQAQALLDKNPSDMVAQAALKQINARITQCTMALRDMAVVQVPPATISELQNNSESISDSFAALKNMLEGIKTKKDVTQADVDTIFMRYDELMDLYDQSTKLGEAVTRGMAGQKYQTAEQTELLKLLAGLTEMVTQFGSNADSLQKGNRDGLWADFLKERQEAEAKAAAQLALINDVTADTLQPAGPPIVAKYLPVTPPAAHDDVSALLSGKLLGDVLVKDGITYGVTVHVEGPTTLPPGIDDAESIKQATLEVFRIENGQYTATTVGTTFEVYADVPHAALSIDGSGVLSVFLNNTLGDKNMQGVLYKMDTATLTTAPNPHLFAFGVDQGWYPYIDEDGKVQNLYIDGSGVLSVCADNAPCAASLIPALDFVRWTDALKAAHSNFTFNTAATPAELPTDVVAKRLTGETGVTALGNYDYMSWGRWNDGAGVVDTIYTNSAWIAGSLTPAADIPATGSASYTGQVVGKLSESGAISNIGGSTSLTANFSNSTLSGTFDMTKNNAAWKTANVDARWGAGTGNIAGTLTTTGMSGAVNGNFFGPAANSVGGAWNLANTAGTDKAAGVFTGNKQADGMITNSKQ